MWVKLICLILMAPYLVASEGGVEPVNLTAVAMLTEEMSVVTKETFEAIIKEAKNGNPDIGKRLETLMSPVLEKTLSTLLEIELKASDGSLTYDVFNECVNRNRRLILEMREEMKRIVAELPGGTAKNIQLITDVTDRKVVAMAKKLHNLFTGKEE